MKIIIKKKGWLKQKFHAKIVHQNGNILFWSENQANLVDLEEMIKNCKRDMPKAEIVYDFEPKNE
jgi:hypothetical protein